MNVEATPPTGGILAGPEREEAPDLRRGPGPQARRRGQAGTTSVVSGTISFARTGPTFPME